MKKRNLWLIRGIGMVLSVSFITYGFIREEHLEVMKKAVNICLQCIGIGKVY